LNGFTAGWNVVIYAVGAVASGFIAIGLTCGEKLVAVSGIGRLLPGGIWTLGTGFSRKRGFGTGRGFGN